MENRIEHYARNYVNRRTRKALRGSFEHWPDRARYEYYYRSSWERYVKRQLPQSSRFSFG